MINGRCLLCFAENKRSFDIINTHLEPVLEKFKNNKIEDVSSYCLCFICHTRLQQSYQLWQLAEETECLLQKYLIDKTDKIIKPKKPLVELSISKVIHISISSVSFTEAEHEAAVKEEHFEEYYEEEYSSKINLDSEDDDPGDVQNTNTRDKHNIKIKVDCEGTQKNENSSDLFISSLPTYTTMTQENKYWADIKHKSKSRLAKRKRDALGTGGGPSSHDDLSETDKKVLAIIGEQAVFGDTALRVSVFDTQPETTIQVESVSIAQDVVDSTRVGETTTTTQPTLNEPEPPQTGKESPVSRPPGGRRRLGPYRSTTISRVPSRIDPEWVMELEKGRVEAEKKHAEAALKMAEAFRENVDVMRGLAETSRVVIDITRDVVSTNRELVETNRAFLRSFEDKFARICELLASSIHDKK